VNNPSGGYVETVLTFPDHFLAALAMLILRLAGSGWHASAPSHEPAQSFPS
jgi:hypothetical protein